ncbi:hypothetical protein MKW98_025291, partial [Papaver atlanticum]
KTRFSLMLTLLMLDSYHFFKVERNPAETYYVSEIELMKQKHILHYSDIIQTAEYWRFFKWLRRFTPVSKHLAATTYRPSNYICQAE